MTKDVVGQVADPIYTTFRAEIHELPYLQDNKIEREGEKRGIREREKERERDVGKLKFNSKRELASIMREWVVFNREKR